MRYAWAVALVGAVCVRCVGDIPVGVDGDQGSMEMALEADIEAAEERDDPFYPPDGTTEQIIETLDCSMGGTVRVTIRRNTVNEPYDRDGYLSWAYTDCVTIDYGTINGTASFSRALEGGPPWKRQLRYNAALEYSGESDGECSAYVQLSQTWHTAAQPLELPTTCPHPVREWWGRLGF